MAEKKIGYKVVQLRDGKYYSAVGEPGHIESGVFEYKIGSPRGRPRGGFGPLAVFGNKKQAKLFSKRWGTVVFRCEYSPSRQEELVYPGHGAVHVKKCPSGTILANSITLLEKVT